MLYVVNLTNLCNSNKFIFFQPPTLDHLWRVYPDVRTCRQKRNGWEGNSHFHGGWEDEPCGWQTVTEGNALTCQHAMTMMTLFIFVFVFGW